MTLPSRYAYTGENREQSWTVSSWVNSGSSNDGERILFQLGWDNKSHYLNITENACMFYNFDGHYVDIRNFYSGGFVANTWYFVQINIIPRGKSTEFNIYVDGALVKTAYDSSTSNNWVNMDTRNKLPDYFFNNNDDFPVNAGKGGSDWGESWWPDAGQNYIDDFRVYNRALDPSMLYNKMKQEYRAEQAGEGGAAQGADIDEAMAIFESRVAEMAANGYGTTGNTLYTNVAPAYEAYKVAVRDKGGIGETDAFNALNEALADMTRFVPATATTNPGGANFNVANTSTETYYRNVIYSEGANSGKTHGFNDAASCNVDEAMGSFWKYGSYVYVYLPQTVILYDGINTPVVPVVLGFKNINNRWNINMLYTNEEMDDFDLAQSWWHGYNDSSSFAWPTNNAETITTDTSNTEEYSNAWTVPDGNTTDYRLHKNGLEFTATPTAAYSCYSSTNWVMQGEYDYAGTKHQINGSISNGIPDIDVINYKKLTDALKAAANNATNKGYLADLTEKYQAGGLENLFAAYDSATTLDPNTGCTYFNHTYNYSAAGVTEAMDKAALLCGNDIDASVALLSKIRINTEDANYERLCEAIEAYETEMAGMTIIHTNLEAAYKKYLLACEYADAYKYGAREHFENPSLADAAQALEEATERMESVADIKWDGTAYYAGNKADNGYSNVVYDDATCGVESPSTWGAQTTKNYIDADYTVSKNIVMVYDGAAQNNVYYPIVFRFKRNGSHVNRICSITAAGSKFALREVWRGYKDTETSGNSKYFFLEPSDDNYRGESNGNSKHTVNYVANDYSTIINGNHSNTSFRYFYNRLYYTGSGDTTNYYEKQTSVTIHWYGIHEMVWDNNQDQENTLSNYNAYVINYKPLRDKLMAIPFDGINVKNYQEGGLVELLQAYDELTRVDPNLYNAIEHPNGYNYSTSLESEVIRCANDIKDALADTEELPDIEDCTVDSKTSGDIYVDGELQPISGSNGAYTNIKIALEEAKNAPDEQGCITDGYWDDYNDALAAAQEAMYVIANNTGTGGQYSEAQINALATALHNAIEDLYDLDHSAHPLKYSYQDSGTREMFFQCFRSNLHILDKTTHDTVAGADGSVYDALNIVYKTLDKTKYKNFSVIRAGKETFDAVKTATHMAGKKPQQIVDDGIAQLISSINTSNSAEGIADNPYVNSYTITFEVYTISADGTTASSPAYTTGAVAMKYGDTPVYDVTDNTVLTAIQAVSGFDSVTAETLDVDHWALDNRRVNITDKSLKVNHQESGTNLTVKAYVRAPSSEESIKLVIKDFFGNNFYTLDVNANTTLVVDSNDLNTVVVGGVNRRVPNSLTYSIAGWGVNYQGNNTSFDTTVGALAGNSDKLTLNPVKSSSRPQTESGATLYHFTMDGVAVADGDVEYDYHMRVNANESECTPYNGSVYGIAFYNSDHGIFVPVTYGTTYRFYVNRGMDFYTLMYISSENATDDMPEGYYLPAILDETTNLPRRITGDETKLYLDNKLPMVYSYSEPTGDNFGDVIEGTGNDAVNITQQPGNDYLFRSNRWTTRSAFTAATPEGVRITGCGTIRTDEPSYATADNLVVENVDGVNVFDKENQQRDPDSNQYSYSRKKTFSVNTTTYTRAYVKYTYTFRGAEISAVAYGPVCASYYGPGNS